MGTSGARDQLRGTDKCARGTPRDREVRLRGVYARTDLDGKKDAYRAMLLAFAEASQRAQSAVPPPPEPEAVGMDRIRCPK